MINLKTNCIIIHGCPSKEVDEQTTPQTRTYAKHWMQWTKRELSVRGVETEIPLMPRPWEPEYEMFREEFERYLVTKDTVLVGHSCGCSFLVRWLGETKRRIAKLVLVAPWNVAPENDTVRSAFYGYRLTLQ